MGKKSTQTTSNEPPRWARDLFVKSADEAERLYNSGSGFNVWEGQTIADPSAGTRGGIEGLLGIGDNANLQGLSDAAINQNQQLINQGGYNADLSGAATQFGQAATGGNDVSIDPYRNLSSTNQAIQNATGTFNQAARGGLDVSRGDLAGIQAYNPLQRSAAGTMAYGSHGGLNVNPNMVQQVGAMNNLLSQGARGYSGAARGNLDSAAGLGFMGLLGMQPSQLSSEQNLQDFAQGRHMGQNTYESDAIRQQAQDLADQVALQYSGAGRYGSGAHTDTLVDSVGDFTNKAFGDQYNRERGMQFQANQMLDAAQGQRFGQGISALQGLLGADALNAQNRLAGMAGMTGIGTGARDFLQGQDLASAGIMRDNAAQQLGAAGQLAGVGSNVFGQQLARGQALTDLGLANTQNQLTGAQGLLGAGQSVLDNQFRRAAGITDTRTANMDRQLAGAQGLATVGQGAMDTTLSGLSQLPTTMQSSLFAPTAQLQAGAIQDQYDQSILNDQIRQFYENDMNEWTRLGALQAAAGGAAGPYGTSVTTTRQPFNPFGFLGGLMSMF